MYGLIGKFDAVPGKRDALIEILLAGASGMPGCLSYVVAKEAADANAIWVTEVWDSRASHEDSLSLPSVRQAMEKGRLVIVVMAMSACGQSGGLQRIVRWPDRDRAVGGPLLSRLEA